MNYRYYAPAVVWALVIVLSTTLPASSIPQVFKWGFKNFDKLIHFLLFAVFGVLLAFAFFKQHHSTFLHRNHIWIALGIGFAFGVITEGLQHFLIPSRSGEFLDIVANFFGTVFGVMMFRISRALIAKFSTKKY